MKQLIIICFVLLSSVTTSFAQPQNQNRNQNQNQDFQTLQMDIIIKRLAIEEKSQEKFKQIYSEYAEKIKELRPKHKRGEEGEAKPTDKEIEQQILDSFDVAEKTTAIKREYYQRFKTVLTPKQILDMYNIERHISDRINSEVQNRAEREKPEQKGRQGQ